MKNTRQQDFFWLAKGHYGKSDLISNAKTILARHSMIELQFIRDRDVAYILLNDLFPLLDENERLRFVYELIDCKSIEDFIYSLLSAIQIIQVRDGDKWILPMVECEPDPGLKEVL